MYLNILKLQSNQQIQNVSHPPILFPGQIYLHYKPQMRNSYLGFSDSKKFGTRQGNKGENPPKFTSDPLDPISKFLPQPSFPTKSCSLAIPRAQECTQQRHEPLSGQGMGEMPHVVRQAVKVAWGHLGRELSKVYKGATDALPS